MTAADVHYRLDGSPQSPPLVMSSSLGTTLEMWDPQLPALARDHLVVRYDHRGHGSSPVPPGPYSVAALAGDALRLMDRLGLEQAAFCGLSLGGMVGIWLAAHHPQRISRLMLLCTSALLGPPEHWTTRARTVETKGMAAVAGTVVSRWFTPEFAAREPAVVDRMTGMLTAVPAEGYAACCRAIAEMDLRADLAEVRAPTLVVAGADDQATPPSHGRAIADALPDGRLVVVPRAAHLANVEQPEAVSALLARHLAGAKEP